MKITNLNTQNSKISVSLVICNETISAIQNAFKTTRKLTTGSWRTTNVLCDKIRKGKLHSFILLSKMGPKSDETGMSERFPFYMHILEKQLTVY